MAIVLCALNTEKKIPPINIVQPKNTLKGSPILQISKEKR